MKRGFVASAMMTAVWAVLFAAVFLALLYGATELSRPFFFSSTEPTVANVEGVVSEIELLLNAGEKRHAQDKVPLFIESDKFVVGFSSKFNKVEDKCYGKTLERPSACSGSSCLCVYEKPGNIDYMKGGTAIMKRCFRLSRVNAMYAYADDLFEDGSYGNPVEVAQAVKNKNPSAAVAPVLHASCPKYEWKTAKLETVFLERIDSPEGFYIVITPSTAKTTQRYKERLRGEPFSVLKQALEEQVKWDISCNTIDPLENMNPTDCYKESRIKELYEAARSFYPQEQFSADLLLEIAEKLRYYGDDTRLRIYNDFLNWYPTHDRATEAWYWKAEVEYSAFWIKSFEPELHKKAGLDKAMISITSSIDSKGTYNPYRTHAYLVRAYYYAAKGDNDAALDGLEKYRISLNARNLDIKQGKAPVPYRPISISEDKLFEHLSEEIDIPYLSVETLFERFLAGHKKSYSKLSTVYARVKQLDAKPLIGTEVIIAQTGGIKVAKIKPGEEGFEDESELIAYASATEVVGWETDLTEVSTQYKTNYLADAIMAQHLYHRLRIYEELASKAERDAKARGKETNIVIEFYNDVKDELKRQLIAWDEHIIAHNPAYKETAEKDLKLLEQTETVKGFNGRMYDVSNSAWSNPPYLKQNDLEGFTYILGQ